MNEEKVANLIKENDIGIRKRKNTKVNVKVTLWCQKEGKFIGISKMKIKEIMNKNVKKYGNNIWG